MPSLSGAQEAIIADHTITGIRRLEDIPLEWIQKASDSLKVIYQHTSHGRQIDAQGLAAVEQEYGDDHAVNLSGTDDGSGLYIRDIRSEYGSPNDLGRGDNNWWTTTRSCLDDHPEINVAMWSFCGGASSASVAQINTYLEQGAAIERDYPGVRFIFMTGHTDGTGYAGTLHRNNEMIRQFCRDSGKILFDFADIESYDPAGRDLMALYVDDECHYDINGDDRPDDEANWAREWCSEHSDDCYYGGSCAHSSSLNCQLKGEAAWWMFARMVGWEGFSGTGTTGSPVNGASAGMKGWMTHGNAGVSVYDIRGRRMPVCEAQGGALTRRSPTTSPGVMIMHDELGGEARVVGAVR